MSAPAGKSIHKPGFPDGRGVIQRFKGVPATVSVRTPHLAKEKMYKTSGHLPYYAESMFPKMEMDEHRTDRKEIEQRIAELEKQLSDHAKKAGSPASGNP